MVDFHKLNQIEEYRERITDLLQIVTRSNWQAQRVDLAYQVLKEAFLHRANVYHFLHHQGSFEECEAIPCAVAWETVNSTEAIVNATNGYKPRPTPPPGKPTPQLNLQDVLADHKILAEASGDFTVSGNRLRRYVDAILEIWQPFN